MLWLVVTLYVISALLPVTGLWRLYRLATKQARELDRAPKSSTGGVTFGEHNVLLRFQRDDAVAGRTAVRIDFALIGGGVVLAAIASIMSLFLA